MNKTHVIEGYNVIFAAVCILAGGIFLAFIYMRTDFIPWAVVSGIMTGFSLGAIYLGTQWKSKKTQHIVISICASLVSAFCIAAVLLVI